MPELLTYAAANAGAADFRVKVHRAADLALTLRIELSASQATTLGGLQPSHLEQIIDAIRPHLPGADAVPHKTPPCSDCGKPLSWEKGHADTLDDPGVAAGWYCPHCGTGTPVKRCAEPGCDRPAVENHGPYQHCAEHSLPL